MEAVDPISGHTFLEHAITGELQWKEQDSGDGGGGGHVSTGCVNVASSGSTSAASTYQKVLLLHKAA